MTTQLSEIGGITQAPARPFALRDLAKLAGVDASTVSRALNHDSRVSAERGRMIRQLASQLGYRPRPLRSKRARSIGLLVMSTENDKLVDQHLERIAWITQRLVGQRRMHVNLECIRPAPMRLPLIVQQNRVDGVILAGSPSVELVEQIRAFGMPAVAINDSVERIGISCVCSDPAPAIHQAILHLAARGHERFALLMKRLDYRTAQAKVQAYETTLRELGIEPNPQWLVSDLREDISGGREGIRQLQQRGALPTAILCENDWLAMSAIQELQQQQVRVPRDVSVIGHDDLWICQKLEPTLTSIQRSEEEIVGKAVDLLLEQLEGDPKAPPRDLLVTGHMVWRDSTGPAPQRLAERPPSR